MLEQMKRTHGRCAPTTVVQNEVPLKSNSKSKINSNANVVKKVMDEDKYDVEIVHLPNKNKLLNNTSGLSLDSDDSLPPQWSMVKSSEHLNFQDGNLNLIKYINAFYTEKIFNLL